MSDKCVFVALPSADAFGGLLCTTCTETFEKDPVCPNQGSLPTKQGTESMTKFNADRKTVKVVVSKIVDLPSFDGYEYTGEYRPPEEGEYCLVDGEVVGPLPSADLVRRVSYPRYILTKVRWRASHGGRYYYVSDFGKVRREPDTYHCISNLRFELGNYFRCREDAESVAAKVRELFTHSTLINK